VPLKEQNQNYVIKITSAVGSVTNEYNLVLEKKSQDTSLSYVKVDELEAFKTEEGNYTQTVQYKEKHPVVIKTVDDKAKVKISYKDVELDYVQGKITADIPLEKGEVLEVLVTVQSENGDEQTYILTITDDTQIKLKIKGKILTENVNGEHLSDITLYKITNEGTEQKLKQIKTEKDGTFELDLYEEKKEENEKYKLKVTKLGNLSYTVTEITLEKGKEIDIGEYKLIAGDIVENGAITIDDLVNLNSSFEKTGASDLNEDGKTDEADRSILKKNYGKKAKTISYNAIKSQN
jgi:hypothetical protein